MIRFELVPVIDQMIELYNKPRSVERFQEYLGMLRGGSKDDLKMPIVGFNPMAKEHVIEKLRELQSFGAEELISREIREINMDTKDKTPDRDFKVYLNLMDDLMGGWTNLYTADYDSKFRIQAFVNRGFATVHFWSSESYSEDLIRLRAREYISRSIWWLSRGRVRSLKDHVEQERFVAARSRSAYEKLNDQDFEKLDIFYRSNADSEEYNICFNFMYGDEVCGALGFPEYGLSGTLPGYRYSVQ